MRNARSYRRSKSPSASRWAADGSAPARSTSDQCVVGNSWNPSSWNMAGQSSTLTG